MTPKEKAIELFIKYSDYFTIWDAYSDSARLDKWGTEYAKLSVKTCIEELKKYSDYEHLRYWDDVLQELELL